LTTGASGHWQFPSSWRKLLGKGYASKCVLLIYLNMSSYGILQKETETSIGQIRQVYRGFPRDLYSVARKASLVAARIVAIPFMPPYHQRPIPQREPLACELRKFCAKSTNPYPSFAPLGWAVLHSYSLYSYSKRLK
jgi:hypothetical protein